MSPLVTNPGAGVNMTIERRLYVFIFIAVLGVIALSGLGYSQIARVYERANYGNVNTVPSLLNLADASSAAAQLRTQLWQYMALRDPAKRDTLATAMETAHGKAVDSFSRYEKDNLSNDADKVLLEADRAALAAYRVLFGKVKGLTDEGKADEARDVLLANQPIGIAVGAAIDTHRKFNADLGNKAAAEAAETLTRATWLSAAIAASVTVLVAGLGIYLARTLVGDLREAVKIATTVAGGDLTYDIVVKSEDEIGQLMHALKEMNHKLFVIVGQVRSGTDTIATASGQIASGSMDLSSRTEQQASSLEETASSMEELASTVHQNAANAHRASELAVSASDVASKGGAVVSQVISTMVSIDASARKIVEIISVIDGIAFQTNILALNAAVEAARAGEQGRGFAVVASEVRNLAHRSAAAAKEIKVLIGNSVEQVEAGSRLVTEAGSTMDDVVSSVKRVSTIISEITVAGQEQNAGIEQINQAITQMDSVTQQNAALVEEAAAAAASLQEQAGTLSTLVGTFRIDRTQVAKATAVQNKPAQPAKPAGPTTAKPAAKMPRPALAAAGQDWESF
jgi:methyl-accepting chemotaxis protein